ncbi:MAG TPA: type I methionyl aminopeptidase, partial [Planctomycetota bacterium]|nr:type I methionyl aminopeptidase [Planctomycetota bacterium]
EPRARARLEAGMVLTIEPIIAASTSEARVQDDGWTIVARDGSLCAHHEETIVITRGRPIVLTRSLGA